MEKYVISLDTSLSNTGYCVFDTKGNPLKIGSIATKSKNSHGERLKIIADVLSDLRHQYDIDVAVFERGFTRYNNSTQALFKTIGVANYIFHDCKTIYYSPATIKKIVGGHGHMKKAELRGIIEKKYSVSFENDDQSDSFAVGLCYFIEAGII